MGWKSVQRNKGYELPIFGKRYTVNIQRAEEIQKDKSKEAHSKIS